MNYVPNQNGKVPEQTLAGSNSDAVKTTLRSRHYFKMTPFLQVPEKPRAIPQSLFHYRVTHATYRSN